MIEPVTKLIQIAPVPPQQQALFRLETADGRMQLADRIQADIDEWCRQAFDDGPRSHLGASVIGNECDRATWYSWRWMSYRNHSARMLRLFQDGHWYEERFIEMLRGIGFVVTQVGEDGKQQRIHAVEGHFGGSSDGTGILPASYGALVAQYAPFLLEFKTINDDGFIKFHDVKDSKPEHWAQMCTYGLKMGIRYAIYFQVNKNDSAMRIEVVELDWNHGQRMIDKGEHIIFSRIAPPRLSESPSFWKCKMCDHYQVCHQKKETNRNCRSCTHAYPDVDKQWKCARWNVVIPNKEAILAGCAGYEPLTGE